MENLVQQLTKLEQRIRACYHKFLDFNGETLVWMMAVDAAFLLEFLQVYAIREESSKVPEFPTRSMSHLVDYAGRKSVPNAILRDIVMLENQIPLFVLRKMLEFKFASSLEDADNLLLLMAIGLFKELSPFKMMMEEHYPKIQVSQCAHLLDFFYDIIVPKWEQQQSDIIVEVNDEDQTVQEEHEKSTPDSSSVMKFLKEIWKLLSKLNKGPIRLIKKVLLD